MIINLSSSGNMCNRLLQFAHTIAIGINNKQDVSHLYMGDLASDFDFLNSNEIKIKVLKNSIFKSKIWFEIRRRIEKLYIQNDYNRYNIKSINSNEQLLNTVKNRKITIVNNWYVRDYNSIKKYRRQIQNIIKPKQKYLTRASDEISMLKQTYTTIIGIHMRRGDYKVWHNGDFYYSDQQYYDLMDKLNKDLKKNKENPIFLLFSNEEIAIEKFNKVFNIKVCTGSPVEDLTVLSMCDYIMGPPSTFSWFAHYLGNSKYKVIFQPEKEISLEDFEKEVHEEINTYNLERLRSHG